MIAQGLPASPCTYGPKACISEEAGQRKKQTETEAENETTRFKDGSPYVV